MVEVIIVIRFAHRREVHHLWQSFLQFIGVNMQSDERRIARFHEFVVLVWRKIDIERHQTVVQERINRARRLNGELRVKFYRILQIAQALLQHRRHLL